MPGSCLGFVIQSGQRDQFLVQFEPHGVVAVGDDPRDVAMVAGRNACVRLGQANRINGQPRRQLRQPLYQRTGPDVQIRKALQHGPVVVGIAVVVRNAIALELPSRTASITPSAARLSR